jgi:pimeloyl-ACP methyl ester carboxylesterase
MPQILMLIVLAISSSLFAAEEMVTIPTRQGVSQSFVLTTPDKVSPDVVLILFPGAQGKINLRRDNGQIKFGESNFLVRERQRFVDLGAATAVIDVPSDNRSGMDDSFRMGNQHATDIGFVIDDLKSRWPTAHVFLVGTSRGTISASSVAYRLKDRIDGLVLTSTIQGNGTTGVKKLGKPVLFVHHRFDGCRESPYGGVKGFSPQFPLITVSGGRPAASGECDPYSAHGYYGVEAPVVGAIMHWVRQEAYPREINGTANGN